MINLDSAKNTPTELRVTRNFYRRAYHDGDSENAALLGDVRVLKTSVMIPVTRTALLELRSAADLLTDHVGQDDIAPATAAYARRIIDEIDALLVTLPEPPTPDDGGRGSSDMPKRLLSHIAANILAAEARGDVDRLKRYRDDAQAVADEHNAIGRRAMVTGGDPFEAFKIAARAERLIEWADKATA